MSQPVFAAISGLATLDRIRGFYNLLIASRSHRLVIALGVISCFAAIVAVYVVLHLIDNMSQGANQFDEEKTKQTINASFDALFDRADAIMVENARWDDAAAHAYGILDTDWFLNTWGLSTVGGNYDAAFVVARNGVTVVGYSDGALTKSSALDFFGPDLSALLSTFPNDVTTFKIVSKIQVTQKGLSIISVAPLLYLTEGHTINYPTPKYLLYSKTFTPEYINEIGLRMIVKGLKLSATPTHQIPTVVIKNKDGSTGAYVSWIADHPGDLVRSSFQGTALIILASVLSFILLFIGLSSWIARRLQISETQAWSKAHTDSLTGLPNRLAIQDHLQGIVDAQKKGDSIVVMLLDIDGFKVVNDSYGHEIGDALIRIIAKGLGEIDKAFASRTGRLGGDEFTVTMHGSQVEQKIAKLTDAIFAMMAAPFNIEGRLAHVGMSIGITIAKGESVSGSELLRRSDLAMYGAKIQGKGCFVVYHPDMDSERIRRTEMAKHLAEALDDQRIEVVFQPIVTTKSRKIIGVEALARWQISPGQYVPPDQFIPVAEEFGLIDRLASSVLEKACREAARWHNIVLSFNVSPKQFSNSNLVKSIMNIVKKTGMKPFNLELEITEGHLIQNGQSAKPILEQLHKCGFCVALDDFGSGYSSIGYLRQYKFDRLKIDRSLVLGMTTDQAALSIVQAATVMAQSMNMLVTAEGVESEEVAAMLQLVGCDNLQGYYFGRPQSAADIDRLLVSKAQQLALA
jgi:diguanylate cyclase (GGDEF)-like protein